MEQSQMSSVLGKFKSKEDLYKYMVNHRKVFIFIFSWHLSAILVWHDDVFFEGNPRRKQVCAAISRRQEDQRAKLCWADCQRSLQLSHEIARCFSLLAQHECPHGKTSWERVFLWYLRHYQAWLLASDYWFCSQDSIPIWKRRRKEDFDRDQGWMDQQSSGDALLLK